MSKKTNVNLGFASVDIGLTISNVTLSCSQYLCNDSGIRRSDRMLSVISQSLESREIGYIRKRLSCFKASESDRTYVNTSVSVK